MEHLAVHYSRFRVGERLLLTGHFEPLVLFAPGYFITMAQGISLPYAQSGAMATEPQLAGTASGVGVAMQQLCGALFAQIYGLLANGTPMPLTMTTAMSAGIGLIVGVIPYLMLRRR